MRKYIFIISRSSFSIKVNVKVKVVRLAWHCTYSPWARHRIFSYWYHLEGQMLPMFFWKFNTHRSWNYFIAMLYSQLSGSNHPLNVTTFVSSGWPRKWGRGNVKSSNSGKNHPILTNDPWKCLSEWVLLCFVCFKQTSLISRSPGVKRLQNLDHANNCTGSWTNTYPKRAEFRLASESNFGFKETRCNACPTLLRTQCKRPHCHLMHYCIVIIVEWIIID